MAKQTFIDSALMPRRNDQQLQEIRVLNWNIGNPSIRRAIDQVSWIAEFSPNIVILTEAKYSEGGGYIKDRMEGLGYQTYFRNPMRSEYCVIMASKAVSSRELDIVLSFLPSRLMAISCNTFLGEIVILGMYVPSRGPTEKRNADKRRFQSEIMMLLQNMSNNIMIDKVIMGGDLNVIERNHTPHYAVFGEWEYEFYESFSRYGLVDAFRLLHPNSLQHSWFGRQGDGYRFDHFFISNWLVRHVRKCTYVHEPRISKLSDHSAMCLQLG